MVSKNAMILLATIWLVGTAQARHLDRNVLQASLETEPCAQVSSEWAAQKLANASATVLVDGQLAYDCLNSVPLHGDDAVRLVRSIEPFLQWQTSESKPQAARWQDVDANANKTMCATASSYLRDPPEDYQFPGSYICSPYECATLLLAE